MARFPIASISANRGRSPMWLAALALGAAALFGTRTSRADCSARAEANACPLRVNGGVVFDRCFGAPLAGDRAGKPTDIGNAACNAIRDARDLSEALGKNADRAVKDARENIQKFSQAALAGSIDRAAIADIQNALSVGKEVESDVKEFLADRECGSPAAMRQIKDKTAAAVELVRAGGEVAAMTLEAANKLAAVGPKAAGIAAKAHELSTLAAQKGPAAEAQLKALEASLGELRREVEQLVAADFRAVASAGSSLVSDVGPYLTACAGCASALSTAVASLGSGATASAGGGVACPETGVSCALVPVGVPAGAATSALASALASVPCGAVAKGSVELDRHVQSIDRFVNGVVKLARAFPAAVLQVAAAGRALDGLAKELGAESRERLRAIQNDLNALAPDFDSAGALLEQRIAPKVSRLAGDFVSGVGRDTRTLMSCFAKLDGLIQNLSADFYEALSLLARASTEVVDGAKIAQNISAQSSAALGAATSFATKRWATLDADHRKLHRALWGVDPGRVDVGRSIRHLIDFAGNSRKLSALAKDLEALVKAHAELAKKAVEEGKRAFGDLERITAQAKAKYSSAGANGKKANVRLSALRAQREAARDKARREAIARAKASATEKARAAAKGEPAAGSAPRNTAWPTNKSARLNRLDVVQ